MIFVSLSTIIFDKNNMNNNPPRIAAFSNGKASTASILWGELFTEKVRNRGDFWDVMTQWNE